MNSFYLRLPINLRRLLFIAGNVGAILFLYSLFIEPLRILRNDQNERISTLREQMLRAERLASRDAEVKELIARAKSDDSGGEVWSGETSAAISAAMQSVIRDLANQSELRLRSIRALIDQSNPSFSNQARIRIEASGDIAAIHSFITNVEQATPFMFGTSLSLRNAFQTSPIGPQSQPQLEVQLDISGHVRAPL